MMSSVPVFNAVNARKAFVLPSGRREPVLDGVSLSAFKGEIVTILGPSGCGKSTLLLACAGLETLDEGSVSVEGVPPGASATAMVFQDFLLFPWRTVLDNVAFGLQVHGMGLARGRERAMELLRLVGLEDSARRHPFELSGGMRQRVGIARALAVEPALLLMDEPFGALDAMTREAMQIELLRLRDATGLTVLFVTHSVPEAVLVGDRALVMSPRPARVLAELVIDLPRPRTPDMLTSDRFKALERQLRAALRQGDAQP